MKIRFIIKNVFQKSLKVGSFEIIIHKFRVGTSNVEKTNIKGPTRGRSRFYFVMVKSWKMTNFSISVGKDAWSNSVQLSNRLKGAEIIIKLENNKV